MGGEVTFPVSKERFALTADEADDDTIVGVLDKSLAVATSLHDTGTMAQTMVQISHVKQLKGDFYGAMSDLYDAMRLYDRSRNQDGLATVYNIIGTIHHYDHNYEQAASFYARSLQIRQLQGRKDEIAILYGNIGSLLEEMGQPDNALAYHRRNLQIRRQEGEPRWLAICYANLGTCYGELGTQDSALFYLEKSLALMRQLKVPRLTCQVLAMLGKVQLESGTYAAAEHNCGEALQIARQIGSVPGMEPCLDCLYKAYSAQGRSALALGALEKLVAVRDSMFGKERTKGLLKVELDYAYEKQRITDSLTQVAQKREAQFSYQRRLDRERNQKRIGFLIVLGVLALLVALWRRLRHIQRSRNLVQQERDRSDALLLNILPRSIADELKQNGHAKAHEVDGVSILFTDFHEFTKLTESMSAQELVEGIDACYRAFDGISMRHGLEKIKTIGDAYMCAGGLPDPHRGSVSDTVMAALEMQVWLQQHAEHRKAQGLPVFRMRAGVHTGPVVAGIVGESKFQYDVWGDTVNIAARFVAAGEVGEVNISEATYAHLRHHPGLDIVPRGKIMTKGKGELEMYYVRYRAIESVGLEQMDKVG